MRSELPPTLKVGDLHLRTVVADDYPFLRALYREVRSEEFASAGWPESVLDAFCDSQFEMQDKHYHAHYPDAHYYVVEKDKVSVGRIYVSNAATTLGLMEISVFANRRGQGLGASLMGWLSALADAREQRMELHVEPTNPAKRLYSRFGFVELEQNEVYLKMQRLPKQSDQ